MDAYASKDGNDGTSARSKLGTVFLYEINPGVMIHEPSFSHRYYRWL